MGRGGGCQSHAIFRPDWHRAKSQAYCCFSHIAPSLLPSALRLCLCVCLHIALFSLWPFPKLSLSAQLYVALCISPPTSSKSPSTSRSQKGSSVISPQTPDGHHSSVSTVSGLKMAPISISSAHKRCNIRNERQSGNVCWKAGGQRGGKKTEEKRKSKTFSWSADIFRPDGPESRTQTTMTQMYAQTPIHSFIHKSYTFRLSSHSCFSLPIFVRAAAMCVHRCEQKRCVKEELTSVYGDSCGSTGVCSPVRGRS